MRLCTTCNIEQPLDQFNKRTASKDGISRKCKTCCYKYHKNRDYKEYYVKYNRAWNIKAKFGITEQEYDDRMSIGVCEICNTDTKLVLDHNHETGDLRGCLCHNCNTALGLLKDDINRLNEAQNYLRKYNEPRE